MLSEHAKEKIRRQQSSYIYIAHRGARHTRPCRRPMSNSSTLRELPPPFPPRCFLSLGANAHAPHPQHSRSAKPRSPTQMTPTRIRTRKERASRGAATIRTAMAMRWAVPLTLPRRPGTTVVSCLPATAFSLAFCVAPKKRSHRQSAFLLHSHLVCTLSFSSPSLNAPVIVCYCVYYVIVCFLVDCLPT